MSLMIGFITLAAIGGAAVMTLAAIGIILTVNWLFRVKRQ